MRGVRVRLCYGILLTAVSLWWVHGFELDESSSVSSGQLGPKRSPHVKSVPDRASPEGKPSIGGKSGDVDSGGSDEKADKPDIGNKLHDETPKHDEEFESIISNKDEQSIKGDVKISPKQDDGLEKDSEERKRLIDLGNQIVDGTVDKKPDNGEGPTFSQKSSGSNSVESRLDSIQRILDSSLKNKENTELVPTSNNDAISSDVDVLNVTNNESKDKTNQDDGEAALQSRTLDSSSTEPIPAESKVYKEFSSRRFEEKSFPFVTTARGSNVVTTTTSRSVKIEEVTEFSGEEGNYEEEDNDEVKEKSKKKLVSGSKDQSTTLRTGKILAGQRPYDPMSGQPVNNRKTAFAGGGYGPPESYGISGGVFRKPVTGYFDTGLPNLGGRKPSPFEVRKPVYSLDSNHGGAGPQRRPSSPYPTYPSETTHSNQPHHRRPPAQDFSIGAAGKNPFLTAGGSGSVLPSLGGITPSLSGGITPSLGGGITQSVGGGGTSRRPYVDSSGTTGKVPFSGTPGLSTFGEGLSAYAERPDPRPDSGFRIRKPSGGSAGEPFSRPTLSRPELEGGFRPLDGGFRPIVPANNGLSAPGIQATQQQVYKQRVKPQRVSPQLEPATAVNTAASGFNLNNIGLNMLYKETNVLNNQDFTSSGGEGGDSPPPSSSSSPPLSLAGDSNQLDSSGVTVVGEGDQGGSDGSGGLTKFVNRTRVKQSTTLEDSEQGESAKRPATNESDDSSAPTNTEASPYNPTHPPRYKIRKPSLLNNVTRKGVESNAIPQELTSRKPVVKNNLKNRLSPSRTKIPSTTSTSPVTTTLLDGTTYSDEMEVESTTTLPVDAIASDTKPSAIKPIIGFNQRKRPLGKHSYPSSVSGAESSTTLSPVKVSSNTRVRKPSQQQAAFATESPTTLAPVKKIKPFVNWASRLQKGTTTEDSAEEMTTVSVEDIQPNDILLGGATSTSSSYGFEPSTSHPDDTTVFPALTPSQSTTPVSQTTSDSITEHGLSSTIPTGHGSIPVGHIGHSQSTTPSEHDTGAGESSSPIGHIGHSQSAAPSDEATTAKLFENTIPSKIGNEKSKYSKVSGNDESKKEDSHFTVNDFISKLNADPVGEDSSELAGTFGHSPLGANETSTAETPLSPLSEAFPTTAETRPPSSVNLTTLSTTQTNHLSTAATTLPNLYDLVTTETITKSTAETKVTAPEVKSTGVSPVDSPPIASTNDDTSLDNVDVSDDMSPGSDRNSSEKRIPVDGSKIETTVSDLTGLTDKIANENDDSDGTTKNYFDFSLAAEKESAGTSVIDVKSRDHVTTKTEENSEKQTNPVDIINEKKTTIEETGEININHNTTTSTETISSGVKTIDITSESDSTRKVPTQAESETKYPEVIRDFASRDDVISRIPTSDEEGSESGVTTVLHTSTRQSTTLKPKPSDPWRTDFSDDFWSKFESTTENNWGPSKPFSDKTTQATPWLKPVSIGEKENEEDSNPVLSSISVTPSTEGTTVSMTTNKQSTKKTVLSTAKTSTPSTVLTTGREESSVSMETDKHDLSDVTLETGKQSSVTTPTSKQSSVTMPTSTSSTTSKVLPPNRYDLPATSEGDFYSEDASPGSLPPPHNPPYIEDPKHFVQLVIHSTPADICASLPSLGQAIIALFQYGSMRVQSPDQMRVRNRDFLCTSPETKENPVFVEFYLTDGMGEVDRDINEEFKRLYNQHGGLDTDLMITDAHLVSDEPIRDEIFVSDDTSTPAPEEPSPRVLTAIVIASVAGVCMFIILVLLFIMRKKGRSFNNRQRCIPVPDDYSLDNVSVYNSTRRKNRMRASKRSYGNPAFDDPSVPSNVLSFPALVNFSRDSRALADEYATIPSVSVRPSELPPGVEDKNRYANVIPIPETRVPLCGPGETASLGEGYINANYVSGPKNEEKFYIACQAPLQNTIEDFWHMVWTHQSRVILMMTALFENSVEKCADYLPPSEVLDCHRVFGDYQITLKKREVREKYVISNLQIKNLETNLWRELTHVWYTSWPTTGVPNEEQSLIAFLLEARAHIKSGSMLGGGSGAAPLIVHCSPGTGRTGTVIACDTLIRQFETARTVDVPSVVYRIRRCRAGAVATAQQYAFIYRVLSAYATKLTVGALDSI